MTQKTKIVTKKKSKKKDNKILREIEEELVESLLESDTPKIVKVIWKDANTMSGTSGYDDIINRGLLTANTIGYLIHEDEESMAICGFLFPDPHHSIFDPASMTAFRDTHIIPKSWIKHIFVLKTDWEETKKLKEKKNGKS